MISIGHIFVLEIVNVYCLIPLVWRSILNVPLFGLFHIFIALNGKLIQGVITHACIFIPYVSTQVCGGGYKMMNSKSKTQDSLL